MKYMNFQQNEYRILRTFTYYKVHSEAYAKEGTSDIRGRTQITLAVEGGGGGLSNAYATT